MAIRDPILASQLGEFKKRHAVISRDDEKAFEHFVNYFVLSSEMRPRDLLTIEQVRKEVHTGGSGDHGIDGVAIFVNGRIVFTGDDVERCAGGDRDTTDAALHFFQTTIQANFDMGKVLKFLNGVEKFLSHDHSNGQNFNGIVKERWDANQCLQREKGSTLKAGQPTLNLYYVFAGYWQMPYRDSEWWQKDPKLDDGIKTTLRRMNHMFAADDKNPIRFNLIDARRLREMHDNVTRRRVQASDVNFPNRLAVPDVSGVEASYVGIMNCKEYVDTIVRDDETRELNQNLFMDNVRLFLGYGDEGVNQEIANTLQDNVAKKQFMLLNNGITIVAEHARVPNNPNLPCEISNYQIVNGCQTTNVLWDNYEHLDDYTYVPVKLVITRDTGLTDMIVRATNMQTPVSNFQFKARDDKQRDLESIYDAKSKDESLLEIHYKRQISTDRLRVEGPHNRYSYPIGML